MEDCTSSEKNSIYSSDKESVDRLPSHKKRRQVIDSAGSEDENLLFGMAKDNKKTQQKDKKIKTYDENKEDKLREQDILFGNNNQNRKNFDQI